MSKDVWYWDDEDGKLYSCNAAGARALAKLKYATLRERELMAKAPDLANALQERLDCGECSPACASGPGRDCSPDCWKVSVRALLKGLTP